MTIFKAEAFRPTPDTPLYQQLYNHLRAAILSGELRGGLKLPSTRALAAELNLSRNTVLNAYEQLLAEGYLESIEGSGTYVAWVLPELLLTTPKRQTRRIARPGGPSRPYLSAQAGLQLRMSYSAASLPPEVSGPPRPFRSELPALDAFPFDLWTRLVVRQARRIPTTTFSYQEAAGYRPLREAIAAHVTVSRQVHCTPEYG